MPACTGVQGIYIPKNGLENGHYFAILQMLRNNLEALEAGLIKKWIKIAAFLGINMFAYFILQLKEVGIFGQQNILFLYMLYNLFFVCGLVLYGFFQNGFIKIFINRGSLALFSLCYGVSGVLTIISDNEMVYLLALGVAVLITGVLSGAAYFSVYAGVPKWRRGRVIAAGIGFGTLIQFLVEVSRTLSGPVAYFYIYAAAIFLAAVGAGLFLRNGDILKFDALEIKEDTGFAPVDQRTLLFLLAAAVAIIAYLSSLYEGVLSQVYTAEEQTVFNVRLLYIASVAAAGCIADFKGRRYLALITVSVMTILILNVFLLNYPLIKVLNWIILFLGAGFLAMFVTLNFIDMAHLTARPALWTGAGRIIKHLVAAFGSVLGVYFWTDPHSGQLIIITQYLLLLIVLIFMLFRLYQVLLKEKEDYDIPVLDSIDGDRASHGDGLLPYNLKIDEYQFTDREKQVLASIIASSTIKEIAASLYISERTVKFHIKNILTKTDTKNQRDLLSKLMLSSSVYEGEQCSIFKAVRTKPI